MHALPLHPCFTPASGGASSPGRSHPRAGRRRLGAVVAAASSRSSLPKTDYDLYDLLGVDSSADTTRVRAAYRALQKRCHPDIAGPPGHDMAIVLNEAYTVLSDPALRAAYDKARRATSEFAGYTGQPLYSSWGGPDDDARAVFVDEVRCVGCLKCALLAGRTFAIEAAHGRARVVAQWADPEDDVLAAIRACPVDCISIVPRSDLAALEFLMSKLPRERVRVGGSPTAGQRTPDVFKEAERFRKRYSEMQERKASSSKEFNPQEQARTRAAQGIMAMAEWLMYWKPPSAAAASTAPAPTFRSRLMLTATSTAATGQRQPDGVEEDLERVMQAAAQRRRADESRGKTRQGDRTSPMFSAEEYWKAPVMISTRTQPSPPSSPPPPRAKDPIGAGVSPGSARKRDGEQLRGRPAFGLSVDNHLRLMVVAVSAAAVAYGRGDGAGVGSGLHEHVAGSLALEIVNSSEMRILLAGVTWYLSAAAVAGLVGLLTGTTVGNDSQKKSKK